MAKFGIEVEFGQMNASAVLAALRADGLTHDTSLHGYVGHSDTQWVLKTDASVGGGGELVSPPLDFDNPEQRGQVNRAIRALRSTGAIVDARADIHVHIDTRDFTGAQLINLARLFIKFEDCIYRIASSGWQTVRRGADTYAPPFTHEQIVAIGRCRSEQQLKDIYFGRHHPGPVSHSDSARYRGLNLQSHWLRGTVEFRVFNSSLNADRIQAYIAVCVALVEDVRRGNRRSITKSYRLGGMAAGTTSEKAAFHRFQQVVRYEAGMSLEDYKLMNKCWKDSKPQNMARW